MRATRSGSFASLFALVVVAACQGKPIAAPDESAAAPPSGAVERVEGAVTARRARPDSATRTLAVRAPVWGDDTVATAQDASVAIRLAHNGALWELQGNQSRRVDEGLAWKVPKAAPPAALADRPEAAATAAAGRHSEQEAGQAAEAAGRPTTVQPEPKVDYKKHTTIDFAEDTIDGNLEKPDRFADLRHRKPNAAPKGEAHAGVAGGEVMGALSPDAVARFLKPIRPAILRCYERALRQDPTVAGRVVVHVAFGGNGRVTVADVATTTLPPDIGACIAKLIRQRPRSPLHNVSIELPFIFKPMD